MVKYLLQTSVSAVTDDVDNVKGPMVGTPGYFSPEHTSNDPLVAASDIYCVGLLLYEMLLGKKAAGASKVGQSQRRI